MTDIYENYPRGKPAQSRPVQVIRKPSRTTFFDKYTPCDIVHSGY